jgi:2,3-diketo-5-methylthio-1-phosphopentane phosphatase
MDGSIQNKKMKLFIDFDGTITKEDVGAGIFLKFGDYDEVMKIETQIRNLEITGSEGWKRLFKVISRINKDELIKFIDTFKIDRTFLDLVAFTQRYDIEIFVLSDGFDFYIEKILEREGLKYLKFFSNTLTVLDNGEMIPGFPFKDEECDKCANCKRNHVLENSGDDEFTVYIGNGSSDVCPAQYCDFIFAKDTLKKFCDKEKIAYFPFVSFSDVIRCLETLLKKKKLKKKHQSVLKRKAIYLQG